MPPRRRTDPEEGRAALVRALAALDAGAEPERADARTAVRHLLEELSARHPGRSVEVRVPPYGVAQCVEGPRHTRGTPPNVVEADPVTWILVATGREEWAAARASGRLTASGERSDLSARVPVVPPAPAPRTVVG
ncbi:sterol carrier family protein [Vallicoccus soli]|uniref:Bacterial SCP orthologue domain-containing protein n=1 Tax=Vallicoccus soli TaxID=2339232 RepID=A0A3A3YVS0_9ACTN|nr:sterol carrier family protein [Vallicoccus soli]RJK94324.1 hypothetical protein D5H78_15215 [Vallicoccus soli]